MHTKKLQRAFMSCMMAIVSLFLIACEESLPEPSDLSGYNYGIEDIIDETIYTAQTANPLTDDEEDFVESPYNNFKFFNVAIVELNDADTIINNDVEDTDIYMEDGNLIVNSTKKMTLVVSGTLNGSIIVTKTDGKFQLVLDGVDIISSEGPAINIQSRKRSFIVISDGTVNNVTDGTTHPLMDDGSNTHAAIYSDEQIILSGEGELNVTGRYKHGIASEDYIKILSGSINILSAEFDGLHANDYIAIDGGNTTISANNDGIEVDKGFIAINGGTLTVDCVNDGIKTSYEGDNPLRTPFIEINNGVINISSQHEGIVSASDAILNNGAIIINSDFDGMSIKGKIDIINGIYHVNSTHEQALDGDFGVTFNGGISVLISGGETATIESDDGEIRINGGDVVIAGPYDFRISTSEQGYIKCGMVIENELLDIQFNDVSIMTVGFLQGYNHVIVSNSGIVQSNVYDVYSGGQIVGANFYGLYIEGTYTGGQIVQNSIAE